MQTNPKFQVTKTDTFVEGPLQLVQEFLHKELNE